MNKWRAILLTPNAYGGYDPECFHAMSTIKVTWPEVPNNVIAIEVRPKA